MVGKRDGWEEGWLGGMICIKAEFNEGKSSREAALSLVILNVKGQNILK